MESGSEPGIPQPKPPEAQQVPGVDQPTIKSQDDAREAVRPQMEGLIQHYKETTKGGIFSGLEGISGSLKDAEAVLTPEQGLEIRRHMVEMGFIPETRTETKLKISKEDRERLASMSDDEAGNAIGRAIVSRFVEVAGIPPLKGAIRIESEAVTVSNITGEKIEKPTESPKQD